MTYITRSQYVDRFGQEELSELLASGSAVSFTAAAADASAIVDSYLESSPSRSSTLPLSPVPARIVEVAGEIARYKLWGAKASEQVTERYNAALAYLEKVAAGDLVVPGSDQSADNAGPAFIARPRVFDDANLAGFMREV
jgi:phage gp36-like protein